MNKFLHYINEVLESLDIYTSIYTKSKNMKASHKRHSERNFLEE